MNSKIEKWEEEIRILTERQREMNKSYTERIKEYRKKIEQEEQRLLLENNQMLADAVREIFGDVSDPAKIEELKQKLRSLGGGSGSMREADETREPGHTPL